MAKKEAQPAAPAPATEIAKVDAPGAIATIPDFMSDAAGEGTEGITKDDIQLPRLAIAQKTSPQLEPDKPEYIEGLKFGDFFNSLTGQIYGRGPLTFVPLRRDNPRHIEFFPREQGGGIKDMNVPPNDPRTQFTTDPATGKSIKPVATKFYDYIVMLLPSREVIAVSCKGTSIRSARDFNGLIMGSVLPAGPNKGRRAPLYAGAYTITSMSKQNTLGSFFIYKMENKGWVWDEPGGGDLAKYVQELARVLADKQVTIDREPGSDDGDEDHAGAPGAAPGNDPGM